MLKKKNLSGSFEDSAIFHVIQLSYDGGGPYMPISDPECTSESKGLVWGRDF